jgi:multisubunit Na+/H+ antiporter MnhB subunit
MKPGGTLDEQYEAARKPFKRAAIVLFLLAVAGYLAVRFEAHQSRHTPFWSWAALAAAMLAVVGGAGTVMCLLLLWQYRRPK